jgi:hypothetical protein
LSQVEASWWLAGNLCLLGKSQTKPNGSVLDMAERSLTAVVDVTGHEIRHGCRPG